MHRPLARLGLCLSALTLGACSAATGTPAATSGAPPTHLAPVTSHPTVTRTRRPVILGLGDSVTTGSKCGCTDFVTAYAAQLPAAASGPGTADNEGQNGLTASQLANGLEAGALRPNLARADTVIVTIGANDLVPLVGRWTAGECDTACGVAATAPVGRSVARVLDMIHRQAKPGVHVLVTGYWNVFEDGNVARAIHGDPFIDWSDAVTVALNAQIREWAEADGDRFVDLYAPFKGEGGDEDPTNLLASDGDHPDAAGETVITKALLAAKT